MYIPKINEEHDIGVLYRVIEKNPLATLVTQNRQQLEIHHVPFLLDTTKGSLGTLYGHVARANPVAEEATKATLVFHGPNAYISPSWYPSKAHNSKVVPTWNYVVMHVYGTIALRSSRDWLKQHVTELTLQHERRVSQYWHTHDAPPEFIDALCGAIVGIEIQIERWQGKSKISQNRNEEDQRGVLDGLRGLSTKESQQMADFMEWHRTR